MPKALVPTEIPPLPDGCNAWARSTRGRGGMYHAHCAGITACGSVRLDRHHSEAARHLGDMRYWGVCARCASKGGKS